MGSCFGKLFQVTTWGESHGPGVGVVVDGCPPKVPLSEGDIQADLDRRRPGQNKLVTQRKEPDRCEILSGVIDGLTLGTPIAVLVRSEDGQSKDYENLREVYRPSHADYTYEAKYGIRDWRGGGRASARETIGRVAAGAIARQVLKKITPHLQLVTYVRQVKDLVAKVDFEHIRSEEVEANQVRWAGENPQEVIDLIEQMQRSGDSVGGVIECVVKGVPIGLGVPVFDRLEADLAKAMLSLPASKGFELGSGFEGVKMLGSEHNDAFVMEGDRVRTQTNRSGGVQGGISNGENLVFRVAFKPVATIAQAQQTVSASGKEMILKTMGRHDPCVLPRAVIMVEAMTLLVLIDHLLRHKAHCG